MHSHSQIYALISLSLSLSLQISTRATALETPLASHENVHQQES